MPKGTLEHANLTVSRPERSAELLKDLLGWEERWRGPSLLGGETIHAGLPGNGADYIALYTNEDVQKRGDLKHSKGQPLNHVGLVVENLDEAEKVVLDAGLETFSHGDYYPGKRFYFFDWDGIEFEIVSYAENA